METIVEEEASSQPPGSQRNPLECSPPAPARAQRRARPIRRVPGKDPKPSAQRGSPAEQPRRSSRPVTPRTFPQLFLFPHLRGKPRRAAEPSAFQRQHFPRSTLEDWADWHWQLKNRLRTVGDLGRILKLTDDERKALARHRGHLPAAITPYYASLMDPENPAQPIRRAVVPVLAEFVRTPGEADDPLAEDHTSPVPGLVHRYPDRVLFLTTDHCAVNCRYCTRSRVIDHGEMAPDPRRWDRAIEYVERSPAVRDVLLSGGDPLTLPDERLDYLLGRLRRIRHVEVVRIGTKSPAVLPQRITPQFVRMLRRYHPLWMSIHFMHPDELTPEVQQACSRLADAGIPLGSQTVLLKGINDSVPVMKRLVQGLLRARVRPYYLYQCDPITGSERFRTHVEKGLEIIQGLRGFTSGYAVPHFVVDAPAGGGKIALLPEAVVGREGSDVILRNYEGKLFRYPEPAGEAPSSVWPLLPQPTCG
jgi:lysine 2,3-aminomutase